MELKPKLAAAGIGVLLLSGASVSPVAAQALAQAEAEDDGFDDWGLLGLLGLVGLAGLTGKKRDDTRRVDR